MTEKEKEVIENLQKLVELRKDKTNTIKYDSCICSTKELDIALNLIEKQQWEEEALQAENKLHRIKIVELIKENEKLNKLTKDHIELLEVLKSYKVVLEKKDKIIDAMAIYIANLDIDEDICKHQKEKICKDNIEVSVDTCIKCIKQYFENKAEE